MNKKLILTLVTVGCMSWLGLTGCEMKKTQHLHDEVLWDKDGNAYMLEHNIGDTYFIHPLKKNYQP